MGLRHKLNASPGLAVVVVLVMAGLSAGVWYMTRSTEYAAPTKAFYTVDEGVNLFEEDVNKVTPFDHEGKQAVKAYVYTCDGGKTRFVAYLERMPEGLKQPEMSEAPTATVQKVAEVTEGAPPVEQRPMAGRPANAGKFVALVRKPGQKDWIKPGDPRYFPMIAVKCPDSGGVLDRVTP